MYFSTFGRGAWPRDGNCDHSPVLLLPQHLTHLLAHPLCALTVPSTPAADHFELGSDECIAFGRGAWPRDGSCDHLSVSLLPHRLTRSSVRPLWALIAPHSLSRAIF